MLHRRALLAWLASVLVLSGCGRPNDVASAPPIYGQAPPFALVDQRGAPFTSQDIQGRVVVANFIFTNCPDICPTLSATMRRVQERLKSERLLGSQALLLSFSIDPARDTPPVLD